MLQNGGMGLMGGIGGGGMGGMDGMAPPLQMGGAVGAPIGPSLGGLPGHDSRPPSSVKVFVGQIGR